MHMRGSVLICVTATVAGVAIGFIGGAFRWCLETADRLRIDLVDWAHGLPGPGWLVPMAAAALGATLAALIVRWVPLAAGSGIQHVEAVYRGEAEPPLLLLLPAKFIGGVLSMGSGLVLGREGPTVHMGSVIGAESARRARLPESEVRMMQTAVGGAGLAVAFNAPIGGTLFALEEVTKSFRLQTVLATLFAAAAAVGCMRLLLGNEPDFFVESIGAPALAWLPLFVVFGLLTGCLGAVYNRLLLWFLDHRRGDPADPDRCQGGHYRRDHRAGDVHLSALGGRRRLSDSIDSERAGLRPPGRPRMSCWSASWPARCRIRPPCRADCSRRCWRSVRCGGCCLSASSAPCGPAT